MFYVDIVARMSLASASTAAITPSVIDTTPQSTIDLTAARSNLKFSSVAINKILNEGSRDSEMRSKISQLMRNDPGFAKANRYALSIAILA